MAEDQNKIEVRCECCGCTEEQGAWGIQSIDNMLICHQCYYDAVAEVE